MDFCHLQEIYPTNMENNYWILLPKKNHKEAKATGQFLGNKITDAVAKSCDDKIVKTKPVEETIIPPEEREEILNELKQVL